MWQGRELEYLSAHENLAAPWTQGQYGADDPTPKTFDQIVAEFAAARGITPEQALAQADAQGRAYTTPEHIAAVRTLSAFNASQEELTALWAQGQEIEDPRERQRFYETTLPAAVAEAQAQFAEGQTLQGQDGADIDLRASLESFSGQATAYAADLGKTNVEIAEVAASNRALAEQHGYRAEGPDRTPVTPEQFLQLRYQEYLGLAEQHGYRAEGPDRTPVTPEQFLQLRYQEYLGRLARREGDEELGADNPETADLRYREYREALARREGDEELGADNPETADLRYREYREALARREGDEELGADNPETADLRYREYREALARREGDEELGADNPETADLRYREYREALARREGDEELGADNPETADLRYRSTGRPWPGGSRGWRMRLESGCGGCRRPIYTLSHSRARTSHWMNGRHRPTPWHLNRQRYYRVKAISPPNNHRRSTLIATTRATTLSRRARRRCSRTGRCASSHTARLNCGPGWWEGLPRCPWLRRPSPRACRRWEGL